MRFYDLHNHTGGLSYCAEADLTPAVYLEKLKSSKILEGIAITNHGMATYFPSDLAWSWEYMKRPELFEEYREWGDKRLRSHLDEMKKYKGECLFTGLEVEMMNNWKLTVSDEFRPELNVLIGSIHMLPEVDLASKDQEKIIRHWLEHNEGLMSNGIDILGHPFRWLLNAVHIKADKKLIRELMLMAGKYGIAMEINAHDRIPGDDEILRNAADLGVKVTFGSDSHKIVEVGKLDYQIELVANTGMKMEDVPFWVPA